MTAGLRSAPPLDLGQVAETCRAAVLDRVDDVKSCILTSRVVIEVLRYLGVPARPWPCRVRAFSPDAWRMLQDEVPPDRWPDTANVIEISPAETGEQIGHLAVIAPPGPYWPCRVLIDASVDQASRPAKGIPLGVLIGVVPDAYDLAGPGDSLLCEAPSGVVAVYAPTGSRAYTTSTNWSRRHPAVRECVAASINRLKGTPR